MVKFNKSSSGFTVVEVLLVILTLTLIAGAGYVVAKHVETKKNVTPTTTLSTRTSANWYLYTSKGSEYKIRLANGLTFIGSNDSSSIYSISPVILGSVPAKVVIQNSGGESDHGIYINYFAKSSDAAATGNKQQSFKTQTGLNVEKYYYAQTTEPQGLGLSNGGKEYTYIITNGSKALTITYDISPGGVLNTSLVEEMVNTVQL